MKIHGTSNGTFNPHTTATGNAPTTADAMEVGPVDVSDGNPAPPVYSRRYADPLKPSAPAQGGSKPPRVVSLYPDAMPTNNYRA